MVDEKMVINKESTNVVVNKVGDSNLVGFGGWLLLPVIGLFLGGLLYLIAIPSTIFLLSAEYSINLIVVLVGFVVMLLVEIYVLVIFLKKKKEAPNYYIGLIWLGVIIGIINVFFSSTKIGSVFSGIVGGVVWTAYFMKSRRVKNTFVN